MQFSKTFNKMTSLGVCCAGENGSPHHLQRQLPWAVKLCRLSSDWDSVQPQGYQLICCKKKASQERGAGLTIRFSWNLDWETSRTISHQQCTIQAENDNEVRPDHEGAWQVSIMNQQQLWLWEKIHNRSKGQQKRGTEQTTERIWVPSLGKTLRREKGPPKLTMISSEHRLATGNLWFLMQHCFP